MVNLRNKIQNTLEVSSQIHNILCKDLNLINKLYLAAQEGAQSITEGGKVIFAGNGGSFADAQHLAAEFIGTMGRQRNSLPAMAIGTNLSSLTAISNDYSYSETFARELSAIGTEKDFIVLLSTSGNSKNLIEMVKVIKKKGMKSIGFLGGNGGKLSEQIPHIIAPSDRTERIQECHILFGHIFCELVEDIIMDFDTN
jgi:D-sedoheptulose 7-phosphate isomerase